MTVSRRPRPLASTSSLSAISAISAAALLSLAPLACGGIHMDSSAMTESESDGGSTEGGTTEGPGTDATTDDATETAGTTGEPLPPADVPEGCNPIAYEADCLLPYPSDVFRVPGGDLPGGAHVELTPAATPTTMADVPFNPLLTHPADGFSQHMPILALFPEGVDTSNLVFHTDSGAAGLDASSATILLNADTGEPVPHWVELDAMTDDVSRQALIVRPYPLLQYDTRYIVAFQGLMSATGAPIERPLGFAHIAAGDVDDSPALSELSARYEDDIFPALEQFGVDRDALQLAWDFTTVTDERNTSDMLTIRADIIDQLSETGPSVMIDTVIPDHNEEIALRVQGRMEVPLYLEADEPMARLHRGGDGGVTQNGTHWVEFTLQVPYSAFPEDESFTPARIIQFGHGFFGLREEINWSAMRGFSSERGFVMIATNWVGMSEPDLPAVAQAISGAPSDSFLFTDRLHQAFANQLALTYAVKHSLPKFEELAFFNKLVYDPDQLYWYGISQGSIFGATFIALSPTIEKAVLNVGGAPYTLMMTRSATFSDLFAIVMATIGDDPLTVQKFIALSQHTLDRVDPSSYAARMLLQPYEGSPQRKILFQYGIGDHSVNNLASHVLLRGSGIDMLEPSAEQPYGVGSVAGPVDGSAGVVVDFQLDTIPGIEARLPTEDEKNDVHEDVRRNDKIRDQIDEFLTPGGLIENFCDGPCDPE